MIDELSDAGTRKAAARRLMEMGEKARPATRALCELLVTERDDPSVILDVLEKVAPHLHKHLVTLLVDENYSKHSQALEAIAKVKSDGAGSLPFLLAYGKAMAEGEAFGRVKRDELPHQFLLERSLRTLAATAPLDLKVIDFCSRIALMARDSRVLFDDTPVRILAIKILGSAGSEDKAIRKKVIPVLTQVLGSIRRDNNWREDMVTIAAIEALGDFGADAKEALPALKKKKRHGSNPGNTLHNRALAACDGNS